MPTLSRNTTAVVSQPQALMPVYNENIIVLSSPNKQSTNFKWLVDLYISKKVGTNYVNFKVTSLVILPNPEGYGIVDVHRHLENYITNDFDYADKNIFRKTLGNNRRWYIDVTEQFENPAYRFDDNQFSNGTPGGGSVAFKSFTDKHPFIVGDAITIIQDLGASNPSYDGPTTVTNIISEFEFKIDKPFGVSTTPEGGIAFTTVQQTRTIYQPDIINNIYWSWNGVLGFNGFRYWNPATYDLVANTVKAVLTNTPTTYTMGSNSNHWVLGYSSTNDNTGFIIESNTGVFWYNIGTSVSVSGNNLAKIKVGPKDITDSISAAPFIVSGALPVINASTTQYHYYFTTGNPNIGIQRVSEIKHIKIDNPCGKYENVELFFLDRLGSFIPFTFNKVSRTNKSISRKNYYQNFGVTNGSSWGYNSTDRGTTTYDIVTNEKVTCTSDWLTPEQVELIDIMLRSPDVYYMHPDGDMRAITITTSSYEKKKRAQDKLINYTITFEYSQNDRNQRG